MEALVSLAKVAAVEGMDFFLRNFSHVPDDKLTWSPTPTSKSSIRIAAHTALYAGRFAGFIKNRKLPEVDNLSEWLSQRNAEEMAITCRHEMERVFRQGTDEVVAVLDSLTPEALEIVFDTGLGWTMPMKRLINLPGWHATLHAGQIDFLQTCWDDQEVHF